MPLLLKACTIHTANSLDSEYLTTDFIIVESDSTPFQLKTNNIITTEDIVWWCPRDDMLHRPLSKQEKYNYKGEKTELKKIEWRFRDGERGGGKVGRKNKWQFFKDALLQ